MLYATVDPRTNAVQSNGCGKCCCEPVNMRPGESNLMTINYAPWSVPLMVGGGPGIVPSPDLVITKNSDACSLAVVGGFGPPTVPSLNINTLINTAAPVEFILAPADNTFTTEVLKLFGPSHGTVVNPGPVGDGIFSYEPMTGFQGYDSFYVETKDAQGRSVVSFANIKIGSPNSLNLEPAFSGLRIPQAQAVIDRQLQLLSFVLELSPDARDCEVFSVNIRQPGRDCNRTFFHMTCIEVRVSNC